MSRPKARPRVPQPPRPVPLTLILERGFVATLAGFVAARPLIAGDDPGRLRLTSGGGPVSFNFCLMLLAVAWGVWQFSRKPADGTRGLLVPLLLLGVGVAAVASALLPDRYSRPG